MHATPAIELLVANDIDFRLHDYDVETPPSSYGLEAKRALGLGDGVVFKTLIADLEGQLVVGIVPVEVELDLKALAQHFRAKRAVMAEPATAARATGYVLGGISPLGQRRRLPTVIDESARELETMFISAGRRHLEIGLAPADLAVLSGAEYAPIGRATDRPESTRPASQSRRSRHVG